ncbi:MAG: hypothetical protein WCI73_10600, partial [Phycisphaerae bacterium]
CGVAATPLDIRLMPKSRYGQFCAAQGIIANICKVVVGYGAGLFFQSLKGWFDLADYAYRFNFVWAAGANIIMAVAIYSLYRQWKALGGDRHYHPPAPWSSTGYEEMEQAPFVGTQTRWLFRALRMLHTLMLLTPIYFVPVALWLWHLGWTTEFRIYVMVLIPAAIAVYVIWVRLERSIRADVARCAAGEPTRDGIPHHGVLFVKACAMLLGLPVGLGTIIVAFHEELPFGVQVFGMSAVFTNIMSIGAVLILCRMERGDDPMLDYDGRKEIAFETVCPAEDTAEV